LSFSIVGVVAAVGGGWIVPSQPGWAALGFLDKVAGSAWRPTGEQRHPTIRRLPELTNFTTVGLRGVQRCSVPELAGAEVLGYRSDSMLYIIPA